MVKDAHEKAGTHAHWAMYELAYGASGWTYTAISGDQSHGRYRPGFAESKKFVEAMGGPEGDAEARHSSMGRPSRRSHRAFSRSIRSRAMSTKPGSRPIRTSGSRRRKRNSGREKPVDQGGSETCRAIVRIKYEAAPARARGRFLSRCSVFYPRILHGI